MAEDVIDELEQQLQREQIDRLVLSVRLFLRQGRIDEAQQTINELRRREPENSEAWELQGDLHRQKGERQAAREAYQQAFKIDPANVNAERKYAEMVLFLGEEERAQKRQREILEHPEKHKPQRRSPGLAIMYGCFFPGLGQFYNRQHEKGLLLFVVGAVILILLFYAVILQPLTAMTEEAKGRGLISYAEQFEMWGYHLRAIPWWQWALAVFGLLVFLSAHGYGVVDAAVVARREAQEAHRLGIEAPS
ncbi:MAG: tetratricopeptide repeat protein [Candidatus Zipacnadales bacterium]